MSDVNSKKLNISLCCKKLWLDRNNVACKSVHRDIEGDYANSSVRNLVYEYITDGIRIEKDEIHIMAGETKRLLDEAFLSKRIVLCDAVFLFGETEIYIDRLLLNADGSMEICEIKAATHVRDGFLRDFSFKCAVLQLLGYRIRRLYIGYINGSYIKNGAIDIKKFLQYKDVTQSVLGYSQQMIAEINKSLSCVCEPDEDICMSCLSPYRCEYWEYCTKGLPQDNVFCISGLAMDRKFELYDAGIISFEDIEKHNCISARQMEQVHSVLNCAVPKINKKELSRFLDGLTFPLYFLDFETFQSAIPRYDGVSPFTQIPFQFSIHYMDNENSELCHKEFLVLSGYDPRRELAEKLVEAIPPDACVLAYNMAFEKGVIRKLAFMFDDLYQQLMNIHDNIKDLMVPFQKHYYYDRNMNGSHSLKAVLPALFPDVPELDYRNLDMIHNGSDAMIMYQQALDLPMEMQYTIRENLLKYCGLDTYAMVKIWQKLKEAID